MTMSATIFDVNEADFQAEVLDSKTPVLVDFWAEWCAPCKMIAPIVDEIAADYGGRLRVAKMDADMNPDVLFNYGIMGIPTLILFKDGEEVERVSGFKSKDKIVSRLAVHLDQNAADENTAVEVQTVEVEASAAETEAAEVQTVEAEAIAAENAPVEAETSSTPEA
jgi:thioredoxin 1